MAKLLLLSLLGVVLLSLSHAALLPSSPAENAVGDSFKGADWEQLNAWEEEDGSNYINADIPDTIDDLADDEEVARELEKENAIGEHVKYPVDKLDDQELILFGNLEDQILSSEADEHVAFKLLEEKRALYTKGGDRLRRKRIAPLIGRAAFAIGRSLFRRFARTGITRSGSRVTRHYNGNGNYNTALRDFNRLRPDNVRSFNGRISGRTGTVGNHRVTVRDGSSGNSRPTLEVRSHNGDVVRKFRYNN